MSFKSDQIARLAESGWATSASVAEAVRSAGLPAVTRDHLGESFDDTHWAAAAAAVDRLTDHFADARFADEVEYGILLVPDPERLDTRRPVTPQVRADQLARPTPDVFDERLPAGRLALATGSSWSMVATVTGPYGPALGSYDEVWAAPAARFSIDGVDTRRLMTRQLWGARVLQSGRRLPDCEVNERWTFTLFAGEALVGGAAESGTVLKGKVRFRLGKRDRGIGSARVAPALAIR